MDENKEYLSEFYRTDVWPLFSSTIRNTKTKNDYFYTIREICNYLKKDLSLITVEDSERFINYLLEKKEKGQLSEGTITHKGRVLHSVFNDLIQRELYLDENPMKTKAIPQEKEYIEPQETPTLSDIDDLLNKTKSNPEIYAIIALICRCGLTPGEVCSIKTDNIIADKNDNFAISFNYRTHQRYVKVPPDVFNVINQCVSSRGFLSDYLFCNSKGKRLQIRDLERKYKHLAYKEGEKFYTLSDIRNFSIALMLKSGAEPAAVAEYTNLLNTSWIKRYDLVIESLMIAPVDLVNLRIKEL